MSHPAIGGLPLVLGGNVFGWTAGREASFAILDAYLEAGGNAIDTADVYSIFVPGHAGGESETIMGEWIKARGNRKDVVLITKGGLKMGEAMEGLSRDYLTRAWCWDIPVAEDQRLFELLDDSGMHFGVHRLDLSLARRG